MKKKRSKRYQEAAKLVEPGKIYSLAEAAETVKKFPGLKFDQSVSVSFRLGVDPRKSDQMVRGTCPLPHGSGRLVRVLVFASGEAATAATNAGAEFVGYEELIKRVQEGFQDFDVAIATPSAMAEVRKLGRFLGPRGLMPNPKTGTVTDDTAEAVVAVKAGRIDFKLDKNGNVSASVGKASFTPEQIIENTMALAESVSRAKPATARGRFIQRVTLTATMSPGLRLDPTTFEKTVS
jgi:large subunit ribosomal protein L1